jgi:hypothetical protein
MTEQGRAAQVNNLRAQGWTTDELCSRLAWADNSVGGSEFMISPDGRYHEVSCGRETPLSGLYTQFFGKLPETVDEFRAAYSAPLPTKAVIFNDGRVVGHQG